MDLRKLATLIERLRREAIGAPHRVQFEDHHVFEYEEKSAKVVAVLKLVRAMHGVGAMNTLCSHGLVIDLAATARGVYDCIAEAYFLMEEYPRVSSNVDQFVRGFFETTLSGHLDAKIPQVPTKKIRAAATRAVKGGQEEVYRGALDRVFRTFSGYVHANYAHIMEVYYQPENSFNLLGVPDVSERLKRAVVVEQAAIHLLLASWRVALTLGLDQLRIDIFEFVQEVT